MGVDGESIGLVMKAPWVSEPGRGNGLRARVWWGLARGGLIGSALGALAGLALMGGSVIHPEFVVQVTANPGLAVLLSAVVGLCTGGVIGAIVALGLHEQQVPAPPAGLEATQIAVFVQVSADVERVRETLQRVAKHQEEAASTRA